MPLLHCRHGIGPPVFLCEHLARLDVNVAVRIEVDGEEMDRWACNACVARADFNAVSPCWRMFCMGSARGLLRGFVPADVEK